MTDCEPKLGCATTKELLEEIATRFEINQFIGEAEASAELLRLRIRHSLEDLPEELLNYRTADS
jgi:hypothetical protein